MNFVNLSNLNLLSNFQCRILNFQPMCVELHPVKTAAHAAFLVQEPLVAHAYQDTAGVRALVSKHDALMNFVNLRVLELLYNTTFKVCIFDFQPVFAMVHPVKTVEHAAFRERELLAAHAYQDTAGVRALVSKHNK